jgi:hypothetical protein
MSEPLYPTPPPPGEPPAAPPLGGPPAARPGLPWDNRKDLGALVETVKLLVTSPGQAYAMTREKGDYGSPLIFAVIFFIFGAILSGLWQLAFGPAPWLEYIEQMPPEMREAMAGAGTGGPVGLVVGIVLTPLIGIVALFIWSGIVHLVLQLLGGLRDSTAGFEGTFRAIAYSSVSQIAYLVPLVGPLLGVVWSIVLNVIGLSTLHRTSQGKALAAVLIPVLLCCCLIAAVFAMMGAAIGAALSGMGN